MGAQFDDGKEAGALRTIGEVAQALGIKQHVLRYWEQQFPVLQPLKRSGGRRYYRAEDIALLESIDRLVNREGYTLKGAKQALSQKNMTQDNEQIAGAAAPVSDRSPLPLAQDLPHDGGLDAFFGRPEAAAQPAEHSPAPMSATDLPEPEPSPEPSPTIPASLVADLKAIRTRLAEALAA